eukprot:3382304-Lingulodinium_polyedra.AAC.1
MNTRGCGPLPCAPEPIPLTEHDMRERERLLQAMDLDIADAANPEAVGRGVMEALIWLSTPQHRRT